MLQIFRNYCFWLFHMFYTCTITKCKCRLENYITTIEQGDWKSQDHKSKMVAGNDVIRGTQPHFKLPTNPHSIPSLVSVLRDELCTENYEFSSSQMCCHWWHCWHNNPWCHKWRQSWCHENYWLSVASVQILYIARVDASTGSSCAHFPVLAQELVEWGGPAAGGAYKR